MILCDTGPLVALIDRNDPHHSRCVAILPTLPATGFVTTWPCLTEAIYLLGRSAGPAGQEGLWSLIANGVVRIDVPDPDEWVRMRDLMHQYQDAPMDLADASLVAAAERLGIRRVFTLDSHFRAYRVNASDWFDIVP